MIKNFKLAARMWKYGFKVKAALVWGAVLFGLGCLFFALPKSSAFAGTIYWMLTGLFITGAFSSLNASAVVQSSPRKKAMQTSAPAVLSLCYYLAIYVFLLAMEMLLWKMGIQEQQPGVLVVFGMVTLIFLVYSGLYKIFILAFVFFITAYLSLYFYGEQLIFQTAERLPLGIAACIGLVEILLGAALQYAIFLLTYPMPINRATLHQQLRRQV